MPDVAQLEEELAAVTARKRELNRELQKIRAVERGFAPTKAPLVRAELARLYPDKQLPFGVQKEIAEKVGLTRERVRQIAKADGYYITYPRQVCSSCGECFTENPRYKHRGDSLLCRKCLRVPIACAVCGKLKYHSQANLLWRIHSEANRRRIERGRPGYTGDRFFCSRTCQGIWAGQYAGWGNPAHPIHHKPPRTPRHGTVTEYTSHGCRCAECKEVMHNAYLERKAKRARTEAGIA